MVTCERSRSLLRYTETFADALPNEFGVRTENFTIFQRKLPVPRPGPPALRMAELGDESR